MIEIPLMNENNLSTKRNNIFSYAIAGFLIFILIIILTSITGKQEEIQFSDGAAGMFSEGDNSDIGSPAPDFTLSDLGGKEITLSALKGKVVLLNVWATWCGPCIAEMPSIEKLYNRFKSDKFEVLAISIDTQGAGVVEPFIRKMGLTFPVLIDPKDQTTLKYRTNAIPSTFIIDKNGIIAAKIFGARDWASEKSYEAIEYLIAN